MYAINARIIREVDGWTSTTHLPTFYLDENVQGIADDGHVEFFTDIGQGDFLGL